jgi:hypothetical protein
MANSKRKCKNSGNYYAADAEKWMRLKGCWFYGEENAAQYLMAQNCKKRLSDEKKRNKAKRSETHRKKKEFYFNDRKHQTELAQTAFNKWVRTVYLGQGCYTCDEKSQERQYQAGHYLTVGARGDRRYNPDNVRLQCVNCNMYNGGRQVVFRANLIDELGLTRVKALEANLDPSKKHSMDELRAVTTKFNRLTKAIKV